MIALSLVERELRVRARQPFTTWLRVGVGLLATLTAASTLAMASAATGVRPDTGRLLLNSLGWLGFMFCLLEGARQTANTLSSERREGTLGLLFLTDLTGFDVALGKLVSATLQSGYGLLAVFPVMGIELTVGGATAGEFWRTILALLNTLFLAAAAGLWVSARSEDDIRAMLGAAGLVVGLTVLPLVATIHDVIAVAALSPASGLWLAGDLAYGKAPWAFWWSQLFLQAAGWGLLLGAARTVARNWRLPLAVRVTRPKRHSTFHWGYRIPARLHAPPASPRMEFLLEFNPAAWLATRQRGSTLLIWLALLVGPAVSWFGLLLGYRLFLAPSAVTSGAVSALQLGGHAVCLALLALVVAHPLSEARRNGNLELLLCTPVSGAALTRAHWQVLWNQIRLPLLLVALLPGILILLPWVYGMRAGGGLPWGYVLSGVFPKTVSVLAEVLAACWVALWAGLRARNTGHAVGWTLALVVLIPWLGTSLLVLGIQFLIASPLWAASPGLGWGVWAGAMLAKPVWLVLLALWARRQLMHGLRETVAEADRTSGWPWPRRKKPSPPAAVLA